MNIQDMPQLLRVTEVAELLRCSPLTIKRKARSKKIRSIRINSRGDFRFFRSDIELLMGITRLGTERDYTNHRICSVCGLQKIWVQHFEPAGDEVSDESYWVCPSECEEA